MFQGRRSLLRERDSLGHGTRNRPLQCWLALVFFASSISAQSQAQQWDACNPSPEVKAALNLLPAPTPDQTKWGFHQKEVEALQALRRQYPNDIFVERRYIETVQDRTERPKVIEEYKAKWMANSQNPVMAYLYGLVLIGPESSESIQLLNGALEKDPKFAWPHLSLAQIFSWPKFRDTEKAKAHRKSFLDLCPTSFEGYKALSRADDKQETISIYAARLRALLQEREDIDAIAGYPTLWTLEFKATSPSEHERLRERTGRDVLRIRALNLQQKREWYDALEEGYRLTNDQKAVDWVKNNRELHVPDPWYPAFFEEWSEDHHPPNEDASEEVRRAYNKELLAQANKWIKERPNSVYPWEIRLDALTQLKEVSAEEIEAAADQVIQVAEKNAGPGGPDSGDYFDVARDLSKRHFSPVRVLEMATKGLKASEIEDEYLFHNYDFIDNAAESRFYRVHENVNGLAYLAEAYIQLKQADKAEVTLSRMEERLQDLELLVGDKNSYKDFFLEKMSSYWSLMGRLAQLQQRKLDAMGFYESALLERLDTKQKPVPGEQDELAEDARKLWLSLGGTSQGWTMWYGRRANELARLVTLRWDDANEPLAPFQLADLNGKTWSVESLKGKVTFLNFWASW
jgi:hypothetical protein